MDARATFESVPIAPERATIEMKTKDLSKDVSCVFGDAADCQSAWSSYNAWAGCHVISLTA
jgi:hypothetical protein